MKVEAKSIGEIKPYENNPRDNDDAVDAVANSIKEFGWQQPIVVDIGGVIIAGHTRYKAAKKLGLKTVPVVVAKDLTEEQVKAYRLADNKSGELATWNDELLEDELGSIDDIDMSNFGFPPLETIEEENSEAHDDEFDKDPPKEPKSKAGQIYKLGRHRLMCGDSTKIDDVKTLMGGYKADLLLTDPPYNVDYTGGQKSQMKILNDHLDEEDFYNFLYSAFNCAKENMKAGAAYYVWYASAEAANFNLALNNSGLKVREELIWEKNQIVLGRQDYQWKHEPCLYGWNENGSHAWYSDRKQTTVLHFDKPKRSDLHPTMKPIPLFDYQIKNSSKAGDIVLDLFGGSGTSIMACEQNNRSCYTMEFDPKYVDVIIDRWESFTGEKAELIQE
ncbi:DNA modification methylase [Lactobacillus crispatus]|uniref:DNA modification methylase n=1 Tax=Lactobacillus crispatus TaxID=47770 RepID=UPI001061A912|nr:DNA modification methylase [Lactobacillus crispatus]MCZ9645530.1 DNA modification methylase [Lactobacillus crispatus]MCZ9650931.1 DNA modification methylase [Lactobacillus crispatus]TDN33301.1 DNA modification methylase [Lactobacillus crispatus]